MATMAEKPSYGKPMDKKKVDNEDGDSIEYLEKIDSSSRDTLHVWDDSIEHTRVGKKTWLIAVIVSMGGFLFGMRSFPSSASLANARQVTIRVSSALFSSH